jgi:predicted lipid-binding transport protein (Tim44 family)
MKIATPLLTMMLAVTLALSGLNAEAAKRLGGGKSFGQQSGNVSRQAPPAAPGTPVQNAAKPAPAATPGSPAAAAPAAAPKRPWGAMLGGLAAGLGLAWLASSLGLGEAFGNILMFGLLALGIMMAVGWFMRNRKAVQSGGGMQNATPFAFQGAGPSAAPVATPMPYRPENVGNDASARPWERSTGMPLDAGLQSSGSMIGSGLAGSQSWGVPADFDTAGFLAAAKTNFVTLQAAWDRSDINALRVMMTDGMLKEIQTQLNEREVHTGGPVNHTEVVMIEAKLLGIEDLGSSYMASVEYSGMIKEDPSSGASPFREVWNMTKPKSGGSGWLVAGVQALQ